MKTNREKRRINENTNAKMSDIAEVYQAAVGESNLVTSAIVTLLCDILIRKGIVVEDEIETLLSTEKINEMRDYLWYVAHTREAGQK